MYISHLDFLIDISCVYEEGIFFSPGNTILRFLWGTSPSSTTRRFVLCSLGASSEPELANRGLNKTPLAMVTGPGETQDPCWPLQRVSEDFWWKYKLESLFPVVFNLGWFKSGATGNHRMNLSMKAVQWKAELTGREKPNPADIIGVLDTAMPAAATGLFSYIINCLFCLSQLWTGVSVTYN